MPAQASPRSESTVGSFLSFVLLKIGEEGRTKKSPSTCQLVSFLGSSGSLLPSNSGVPRLTIKLSPQLLLSLSIRSSPPNRSLIAAHALMNQTFSSGSETPGL